ncbi:MAG: hypothetical protein KIS67_24120 [Verrucomicrobiae bacterium]|nr:hypothetical protein [Verrucomicrobiae bacterium]
MNIRAIRNPLLRLVVLLAIGFPCLFKWPFSALVSNENSFAFLGMWMGYCAITSALIIRSVGAEQWARSFAVACVLAIVTLGPAFLGLEVWERFQGLLEKIGLAFDKELWTWKKLQQGVMIVTIFPYVVFMVNCFSVSNAVQRASSWIGAKRMLVKHSLIVLRVCQHAIEVLPPLVLIWREQHPKLVLPRHRNDWSGVFERALKWSGWFVGSVGLWVKTALVFTLEPLATFCAEIDAHFPETESKGKL